MTTLVFVAQVTREAAGYSLSFVDLPECHARGGDMADLLVSARGALLARLKSLADAGEAWPAATPIERAPAVAAAFPVLVDVVVDDTPVRVNISLGERLLERLDAATQARNMTRSGFIAHAVRVSLGERPSSDAQNLQDELSNLGRKITDSIGPDSPFSRRMAELDGYLFEGVRKAADSVSAAMVRRQRSAAGHDAPPQPGPGAEENAHESI
jgi:predicted RNase H-like HicB family nuclease